MPILSVEQYQELGPGAPDEVAALFGESKVVSIKDGLIYLQDLTRREDERFKHLDSKATTLYALLGLALTALAALGTFVMRSFTGKKEQGNSWVEHYVFRKVSWLYILASAILCLSFLLAMGATQVSFSNFLGFELGMRHEIDPRMVYGYENLGSEKYNQLLLAEYIKLYEMNLHSNNVKAAWLSGAQALSFSAIILLFGAFVMIAAIILRGPPPQEKTVAAKASTEGVGNAVRHEGLLAKRRLAESK